MLSLIAGYGLEDYVDDIKKMPKEFIDSSAINPNYLV